MVTYRTDDPARWGVGKGANLTASEIDGNFWELAQRLVSVETNPAAPNQISAITVVGSQMTIHMQDASTHGPFTLPTAMIHYRGDWAAGVSYDELDIVAAPGNAGIYLATRAHVSATTFDPLAADAAGNPLYQWLFPTQATGLSGLSDVQDAMAPAAGQALDYDGTAWAPGNTTSTLAELRDTYIPANPAEGQFLSWQGSTWRAVDLPASVSSFLDLTDTPAAFGVSGQIPAVNSTGNGLVFVDPPASGVTTFLGLSDTPAAFGAAGTVAAVNAAGTGLEFIAPPSAGGALNDLSDVTIATPASKQFLRHNGTAWVNAAAAWGDITAKPATIEGLPANLGGDGQILVARAGGYAEWTAPMAPYLYWRLRLTGEAQGSTTAVCVAAIELRAREDTGAASLSQGYVPNEGGFTNPHFAFTGAIADYGEAVAPFDGKYLQTRLTTDIRQVVQFNIYCPAGYHATNFVIEASHDGNRWVRAATVVDAVYSSDQLNVNVYPGQFWQDLLAKPATVSALPAALGAAGQVMKVDATGAGLVWAADDSGTGGATNLDGLSDVVVTTPAVAQVLRFNGTEWVNVPLDWADVANRPATFPPSAHTHPWVDVTDKPATFPPSAHSHPWSEVTSKPATVAALPAAVGAAGEVLKAAADGTISWAADEAGGGGGSLTPRRHWRLRFIRGQSASYAGITELYLNGVARTGTVKASSHYNASYVPANAFDNDINTTWISAVAPVGEWIAIDLGAGNETDVSSVDINSRVSGTIYEPLEFAIEWSDDGTTWTVGWEAVVSPNWVNNERRTFTRPALSGWDALDGKPATIQAIPEALGASGEVLKVNGAGTGIVWTADEPVIEKGIFTPVVVGDVTAGTATYTYQWGDYMRDGDKVFVNMRLNWSGHTGTGTLRISGLPFVSRGHRTSFSLWPDALNTGNANHYPVALMWRSDSYVQLYGVPLGGPDAAATLLPLPAAGNVILSGTYHL